MKKNTGSIFNNILTSGLPRDTDIEVRRRFLYHNTIMLVGFIVLIFFGTRAFMNGDVVTAITDFSTAGVIVLAFVLLRLTRKYQISAVLSLIAMYVLCITLLLRSSANDVSGTLWILSYPLMVVFLLRIPYGLVVAGAAWISTGIILFVSPLVSNELAVSYKIRMLGVYLVIMVFSYIYETVRQMTQHQLESVSQDLRSRKRQTDSILENIEDGIFVIDKNAVIGAEYSTAACAILEQNDLEGKNLLKLLEGALDAKIHSSVKDYIDLFDNHKVNKTLLPELNPLDNESFVFKDSKGQVQEKFLTFKFNEIHEESSNVLRLLVSIQDNTEEIKLNRKLAQEERVRNRQMENLFQIIHVEPALMNEFIIDSRAEIQSINENLKSNTRDRKQLLHSIYQSVHAIKGNALLLGLQQLTKRIHTIEDRIKALLETDIKWKDLFNLTIDISKTKSELDSIAELIDKISRFHQESTKIKPDKNDFMLSALKRIIEKTSRETSRDVVLKNNGFKSDVIPDTHRKTVKDVLLQLVRNSIVHGFEDSTDRLSAKKPREGIISIVAKVYDDTIEIKYADDGRGLDIEKIRQNALKKGLYSPEKLNDLPEKKIMRLIFHPGLSTAEKTSIHAGRGVGMALVKKRIEEAGGRLYLQSKQGQFCKYKIVLPVK